MTPSRHPLAAAFSQAAAAEGNIIEGHDCIYLENVAPLQLLLSPKYRAQDSHNGGREESGCKHRLTYSRGVCLCLTCGLEERLEAVGDKRAVV